MQEKVPIFSPLIKKDTGTHRQLWHPVHHRPHCRVRHLPAPREGEAEEARAAKGRGGGGGGGGLELCHPPLLLGVVRRG